MNRLKRLILTPALSLTKERRTENTKKSKLDEQQERAMEALQNDERMGVGNVAKDLIVRSIYLVRKIPAVSLLQVLLRNEK